MLQNQNLFLPDGFFIGQKTLVLQINIKFIDALKVLSILQQPGVYFNDKAVSCCSKNFSDYICFYGSCSDFCPLIFTLFFWVGFDAFALPKLWKSIVCRKVKKLKELLT